MGGESSVSELGDKTQELLEAARDFWFEGKMMGAGSYDWYGKLRDLANAALAFREAEQAALRGAGRG
jgi:hypothetical protein